MEIDLKHLDAFKKQFDSLDVSSIQLMLRFRDKVYLLHTLKDSFEQINKMTQKYHKSRKNIQSLSRQSMGDQLHDNQSIGGQSQMSCYDVICNHSRYQKEKIQIEEDDIFKFNSEDIQAEDFISLQVVACKYELPEINEKNMADSQKEAIVQKCKENTDSNGLLVLAKSDLKLTYLIRNNSNTIRTMMRSEILQCLDVSQSTDSLAQSINNPVGNSKENYSKEGKVIGNALLKISFMRKQLFPADHINLEYQKEDQIGLSQHLLGQNMSFDGSMNFGRNFSHNLLSDFGKKSSDKKRYSQEYRFGSFNEEPTDFISKKGSLQNFEDLGDNSRKSDLLSPRAKTLPLERQSSFPSLETNVNMTLQDSAIQPKTYEDKLIQIKQQLNATSRNKILSLVKEATSEFENGASVGSESSSAPDQSNDEIDDFDQWMKEAKEKFKTQNNSGLKKRSSTQLEKIVEKEDI